MSQLIDISPLLSPRIAVWPGDVGFERQVSTRLAAGDDFDLSSMRTTLHAGAHADAPSHYRLGGQPISERGLHHYYGPCQVIDVRTVPGGLVLPTDLCSPIVAPRILLQTRSVPDPERWNADFTALSPAVVHALADAGCVLVGIDSPSVDPFDSEAFPSHRALADRDLAVLEGLCLAHVAPGHYTLIALPLKIEGADASPVRAALVKRDAERDET